MLSVTFEKIAAINEDRDQSQPCKRSTIWLVSIGMIKTTIFKGITHYHLYKISTQIIECIIFASYDFLCNTIYNSVVCLFLYKTTYSIISLPNPLHCKHIEVIIISSIEIGTSGGVKTNNHRELVLLHDELLFLC